MTKQEYLQSQIGLGKTITQIINDVPTTITRGSIDSRFVQEMTTALASGLQYDLDSFNPNGSPDLIKLHTAMKIAVSLQHIYSPEFKINFSLDYIWTMYQSAIAVGIISQNSANMLAQLYLYQKPDFELTREEVAAALYGTDWNTLNPHDLNTIRVIVEEELPENTTIRFEMREEFYQDAWFGWSHVNTLFNVKDVKMYKLAIPHNGVPREIRWKCEYHVVGTVEAV